MQGERGTPRDSMVRTGTAQDAPAEPLCMWPATRRQRRGLCRDLARWLVALSARTALTVFFSFLWRVQSPELISSRVTVPTLEPQATTRPVSCRRRLESGSLQTWGGRTGRGWH